MLEEIAQSAGGKLPTWKQWNKAAGAYSPEDDEPGPFLGLNWDPAVREIALRRGKVGPLPVGAAEGDVIRSSRCRDMAGNGQELTRTLQFGEEEVPKQAPLDTDAVVVRGCTFDKLTPPIYTKLREEDDWEVVPYKVPRINTGFRVVIEP